MKLVSLLAGMAARSSSQCRLEIIQVQDGSTSFASYVDQMLEIIPEFWEVLNQEFENVRLGVTSFTDKPTPFRGWGKGRGVSDDIDYCYRLHTPMTEDIDDIMAGFNELSSTLGSGGDYPENPYEGMVYTLLDPATGYNMAQYTDDGIQVVRILLVVTDDHPHYDGDVNLGIALFNPDLTNIRFYHSNFFNSGAIYPTEENRELYDRLVELHTQESLTEDEESTLRYLEEHLGPPTWEQRPMNSPDIANADNCDNFEYLSLEQVGAVINEYNVIPIVVISPTDYISPSGRALCIDRGFGKVSTLEDYVSCLQLVYEQDFDTMGVEYAEVTTFDGKIDNFLLSIEQAIMNIKANLDCDNTEEDETENENEGDGGETDDEKTDSDQHTEEGSTEKSTSILIKAATGSAAVAAGIAAAAYNHFRLGRSSNGVSLAEERQVDTPDVPIERETRQVMTMDMFE